MVSLTASAAQGTGLALAGAEGDADDAGADDAGAEEAGADDADPDSAEPGAEAGAAEDVAALLVVAEEDPAALLVPDATELVPPQAVRAVTAARLMTSDERLLRIG